MSTPLQRALQLCASKWGGIVKFSWFEGGDHSADVSQEATVFSAFGGHLRLENLVLEDMDSVDAVLTPRVCIRVALTRTRRSICTCVRTVSEIVGAATWVGRWLVL